jgi:hypothetical protein
MSHVDALMQRAENVVLKHILTVELLFSGKNGVEKFMALQSFPFAYLMSYPSIT